jgi:hypothetical protein
MTKSKTCSSSSFDLFTSYSLRVRNFSLIFLPLGQSVANNSCVTNTDFESINILNRQSDYSQYNHDSNQG